MAVVAAASLLLVTACGSTTAASSGDAAPLSSIKITPGSDDSSDPTVTFDTPLVATETAAKVIVEGKGDDIKENQNIKFKSIAYGAEDASMLGSGFSGEPVTLPTNDEFKTQLPALYETLMESKVGSWVAMVEPAAEAAAASQADGASPSAAAGEAKAETVVVLKVLSAEEIPEPAIDFKKESGDPVKDAKATAKKNDKDKYEIDIPAGNQPPEKLQVETLVEGEGKAAKSDSVVTADYAGAKWSDGVQFDSSYERGEPSPFSLTEVIKGWTQGLEGVKEGSTVLLTIPEDLAYGADAAASGRPDGALVFIVEVKSVEDAK